MSDKSIHVSAAAADAADTFKGREEAKKVVHSSVRRMSPFARVAYEVEATLYLNMASICVSISPPSPCSPLPSFPSSLLSVLENGLPPSGNNAWSAVLCEMLRLIKSFLYLNPAPCSSAAASSNFHDFLCPTICPGFDLPPPSSLSLSLAALLCTSHRMMVSQSVFLCRRGVHRLNLCAVSFLSRSTSTSPKMVPNSSRLTIPRSATISRCRAMFGHPGAKMSPIHSGESGRGDPSGLPLSTTRETFFSMVTGIILLLLLLLLSMPCCAALCWRGQQIEAY